MTSNFNASHNIQPIAVNQSQMNNYERDRFELLSAYLDGEVTATERQQVKQWLDNDCQVQQLYQRLLQLRQGMQNLPVPKNVTSSTEISQKVFQSLDRRRFRRLTLIGGGAIAAMVVGAISTLLPQNPGFSPQIAQSPPTTVIPTAQLKTNSAPLMIAINQPIIEIPKAPVSGINPSSATIRKFE